MAQFEMARRLERRDLAALRIDAGHDVRHDAVLARRIHALQDDKDRPAPFRVKPLLQLAKPDKTRFESGFRIVLRETVGVAWIDVGELDGLVRPQKRFEISGFHTRIFARKGLSIKPPPEETDAGA